jgi:hypothetical protein
VTRRRDADCANTLHDRPLPRSYVTAIEVAERRVKLGWTEAKCPDCGLYGWVPPMGRAS